MITIMAEVDDWTERYRPISEYQLEGNDNRDNQLEIGSRIGKMALQKQRNHVSWTPGVGKQPLPEPLHLIWIGM